MAVRHFGGQGCCMNAVGSSFHRHRSWYKSRTPTRDPNHRSQALLSRREHIIRRKNNNRNKEGRRRRRTTRRRRVRRKLSLRAKTKSRTTTQKLDQEGYVSKNKIATRTWPKKTHKDRRRSHAKEQEQEPASEKRRLRKQKQWCLSRFADFLNMFYLFLTGYSWSLLQQTSLSPSRAIHWCIEETSRVLDVRLSFHLDNSHKERSITHCHKKKSSPSVTFGARALGAGWVSPTAETFCKM